MTNKEAIEAIKANYPPENYSVLREALDTAVDLLEQQKTGQWIYIYGRCGKRVDRRTLKCSVCGNHLSMDGVNGGRGDANFCPNCGARMEKHDK